MKKNTRDVLLIVLIALAACFAGCSPSQNIGCYGNKQYINAGSGFHQDPPPLRKTY